MFGLLYVKWFGFIPKRPKQSHPQLVRWWVLVPSGHGLDILQLANSFASRQPTKTYGD
jgi:hypothetical protein